MGAIQLRLPPSLGAAAAKALEIGYFVGLPDYMPWITQVVITDNVLAADKEIPESGCLCVPWTLPSAIDELPTPLLRQELPLILSTATVVERAEPYRLSTELARGKVNHLRNQAADWQSGGLEMTTELEEAIRAASRAFGRAVCQEDAAQIEQQSEEALLLALAAGEDLVEDYVDQVMQARTARSAKLSTHLSCATPSPVAGLEDWHAAFNSLRCPFNWREIEAEEGQYQWEKIDAWIDWAKPLGKTLEAGPLFEMSPSQLPAWLPGKLGDPQAVANLMLDFLEAALERYRDTFKLWQISSGLNDPTLLELDEEESLWLNTQLYAAAQQVHPSGEFSLRLSQPWGEAVAKGSPAYSPFVYADALLRSRVLLAALDLELVFGVWPRGSLLRDRLDVSRLFDLYALLGIPLKVTLGLPAAATSDPQADATYQPSPFYAESAWTPDMQANLLEPLARLIICKPFINGLTYVHLSDAEPHLFPNVGLVDSQGQARPALAKLRQLREKYLN